MIDKGIYRRLEKDYEFLKRSFESANEPCRHNWISGRVRRTTQLVGSYCAKQPDHKGLRKLYLNFQHLEKRMYGFNFSQAPYVETTTTTKNNFIRRVLTSLMSRASGIIP